MSNKKFGLTAIILAIALAALMVLSGATTIIAAILGLI